MLDFLRLSYEGWKLLCKAIQSEYMSIVFDEDEQNHIKYGSRNRR